MTRFTDTNPHVLKVRVYLEDTDAQGIVYHANYLRFLERARTEMIDLLSAGALRADDPNMRLVVHEMNIKYSRAARLGEWLEVRSTVAKASAFRLCFEQRVFRPEEEAALVIATAQVVSIDQAGKLMELPSLFC